MFFVTLSLRIRPGRTAEFEDALLAYEAASVRDEPRCLRFDVLRDAADPHHYLLYRAYTDDDAFADHLSSVHFAAWRAVAASLIEDGAEHESHFRPVRQDIEAIVDQRLSGLDLAAKIRLLSGQDMWSLPAEPAIGLRPLVMSDGPVGVRGTGWMPDHPSVALPSPTALAATWDLELARHAGRVLGAIARRREVHVLLAPTVNLHRSPLGGRHFECYSEDPLLSGLIGSEYVSGLQGMGVAATVKHLVANDSETDRMTVDVRVSPRALRELYLLPFEMIVRRARPWAVMAAYNRVNGVPMTEHRDLLSGVLKGDWGFDGVVMSDWCAARSTVEAALGGLDVVMPALSSPWGEALLAAVRDGRVPEPVVDDKVRRVLRLAARVGALASAASVPAPAPPTPGGAADAGEPLAAARSIAVRAMVLAKNDGVLPLRADRLRSVAVIGAPAVRPRAQGGGSAEVSGGPVAPPMDALETAFGSRVDVTFAAGADPGIFLPPANGPHWQDLVCTLRAQDGRVLHRSTLDVGAVRWMGDHPGEKGLASVELSGRFTPAVGGTHSFAVSGFGDFTLEIAGATVFRGPLYRPDADPAEVFHDRVEHRVGASLTAGRPVEVRLSQHFADPVRTQFVAMTLGHAPPSPGADATIAEAVAHAAAADVAIVFVGTTEETETEGADRTTLALPGRQDDLVARVAAVNPATVVVVNSGSPVVMPWVDDVAAVLIAWFPGQQAGPAIADVLLGVHEPGGRLPTTWPRREADCPVLSTTPRDGVLRYDEGVLIGYRAWAASGREPLFPFGHGLGYTSWAYERMETDAGGLLVTVRNTGERAGREVVQAYARPCRCPQWTVARLAGFAVAEAGPGEAATVRIDLPEEALRLWDDGWRRPDGPFLVEVGRSFGDRRLSAELPGSAS